MARGFFDLVKEQQDRGYGAFQGGAYSPEQLAAIYQGSSSGKIPPTNWFMAGAGMGGPLGDLFGRGIGYLLSGKRRKAAAQKKASDDRAMDLIRQRAGELSAQGVPMEEAFATAANESFGESAGWERAGRLKDAMGRVAPQVYTEASNFGGEAKQYAPVYNTWADWETGETRQVNMKDKKEVESAQKSGMRRLGDVTIQWGQIGDTDLEQAYNVIPGVGMMPIQGLRRKRGKTEVNVNMGDPRTESQRGLAYGEALQATRGFQSANEILGQINDMADSLDFSPAGIPGTGARLANTVAGVGEFALSIVGAQNNITPERARTEKIYDGGKLSYEDLLDPSRYQEQLQSLSKKGITSARVQASLIELAYMMAVAEEGSARAISDNDLRLRLRTLGENMSSKEGFKQLLKDTQSRLYLKYRALVENDPIFQTQEDNGWLSGRASSLLEKYGATADPGVSPQPPKKRLIPINPEDM